MLDHIAHRKHCPSHAAYDGNSVRFQLGSGGGGYCSGLSAPVASRARDAACRIADVESHLALHVRSYNIFTTTTNYRPKTPTGVLGVFVCMLATEQDAAHCLQNSRCGPELDAHAAWNPEHPLRSLGTWSRSAVWIIQACQVV